MNVKLVSFSQNPNTNTIKKIFLVQTNNLPVKITLTNFPEVGERNFFQKLKTLSIPIDENNFLEFDVSNDILNDTYVDIPINMKSGNLYKVLTNINQIESQSIHLYKLKGKYFQYLDKNYEYQNCILSSNKQKVSIHFFNLISPYLICNQLVDNFVNKAGLLWVHDQIVQKMIDFDKNHLKLISKIEHYDKNVYLNKSGCWQVSENSMIIFILNQIAESLSFDELFEYIEQMTNCIDDNFITDLLIQSIAVFKRKIINTDSFQLINLNNYKETAFNIYGGDELDNQFMNVFNYCTKEDMQALIDKLSKFGQINQYYNINVGEYKVLLEYCPERESLLCFKILFVTNHDLNYNEMRVYYGENAKVVPLNSTYHAIDIDIMFNFSKICKQLKIAKRNKITVPNIYGQKILFQIKYGIAKAIGILV